MSTSTVAGSGFIYNQKTGKEIIAALFGDDIRPPLTNLYIEAKTTDGKIIKINVSNNNKEEAFVVIE